MSKPRRALHQLVVLGAALVLVMGFAGCDRPKPPAPSYGMPPLEPGAAVEPASKTHAEHALVPVDDSARAMPPGHPAVPGGTSPHGGMGADPHGGMGADPHGGMGADPHAGAEAATPGDIPFDAKTLIKGELRLDPKVKDQVKAGDVIYLVARRPPQGANPGPVVAVRRLEAGAFPMSFQLDSRDAMMMGGAKMEGPLVLTARVDKDGDAMTKNPGDITGSLTLKTLPVPKAALTLDTVL
jgi:hypothetical protein